MRSRRLIAVSLIAGGFIVGSLVSAGQNLLSDSAGADTWSVDGRKSINDENENFSDPLFVETPDPDSKDNLVLVVQYDEVNGPVLYSWLVKKNGNVEAVNDPSVRYPVPAPGAVKAE